jgi:hypothetical protein
MTLEPPAKGSLVSRAGGGLLLLAIGLACGGAIAVAPDIAAAALVLQIPGAVALLLDPSPGRAIGKTMLLCQGAASVRPVVSIWFQCDQIRACVAMAIQRTTVLTVLLAAAGGFVLAQALPLVLKVLDDARIKIRAEHLVAERKRLVAEWEMDG